MSLREREKLEHYVFSCFLFYIPVHPRCLLWPDELHIPRSILDSLSTFSRCFLNAYGNSNSWSHFESSFEGRVYTEPLQWRIAQIRCIKQNKKHYTADSRFSKTAYHSQWTGSTYPLEICFYELWSPVCCSSVHRVSPALLSPASALPVTAGCRLSL